MASRKAYHERLKLVLPQFVTGTTSTANPVAAAVVFVALYVGAVDAEHPIRPKTVSWMSDSVAKRRTDPDRRAYYKASRSGSKAVSKLCVTWGIARGSTWYADDSREPIRDETLKEFANCGAVKHTTVTGSSPLGRYYLDPDFAALFEPSLLGEDLAAAIVSWQEKHLKPLAKLRAAKMRDPALSTDSVIVNLPGGGQRTLHPGLSSRILKGVIEDFASTLAHPNVIFISQSGEKVNLIDDSTLKSIGLTIDKQKLLPDCLIADLDKTQQTLWFIEVVATGGPITTERRDAFLEWAGQSSITVEQCRFLTAFESRTRPPAKSSLPRLATRTHAWYADEPMTLLTLGDIAPYED